MIHSPRLHPHWSTGRQPRVPDRFVVVGLVVLAIMLAVEVVLVLAPLVVDPLWLPRPTLVPDPFFPRHYA